MTSSSSLTIQSVQEQAHNLWRYQRFLIIMEYTKRAPVPPPFNTFYYLFVILRFVARHCFYRRRMILNSSVQQDWTSK